MVRFVRFALETLAILASASIVAALLFRVAPGADIDASEVNPRLSEATKDAIRARKTELHRLAGTSFAYYKAILRGDLGASESDGRPVAEHLRERAPSTIALVVVGSTAALLLAFAVAL